MFVQRNMWVYLLSYGVFIVTYITLVCCSGVRRKYPGNIIMLSIFTLAMSYMTGTIASTYDTKIVLMTVGITAVICFLISIFAMQTKVRGLGYAKEHQYFLPCWESFIMFSTLLDLRIMLCDFLMVAGTVVW